jgi:hypothetical protein
LGRSAGVATLGSSRCAWWRNFPNGPTTGPCLLLRSIAKKESLGALSDVPPRSRGLRHCRQCRGASVMSGATVRNWYDALSVDAQTLQTSGGDGVTHEDIKCQCRWLCLALHPDNDRRSPPSPGPARRGERCRGIWSRQRLISNYRESLAQYSWIFLHRCDLPGRMLSF